MTLRFTREFLFRACLVAVLVCTAHQFRWELLRFITSEAILHLSAFFGMATARVSFDTIWVQHAAFSFLVACTFADVIMGSIPLIWNNDKSLVVNSARLIAATTILFIFNVIRLEIGQILYSCGVSWTFADQVLGGISYFVVWLVIWRQRTWRVFKCCPVPSSGD